MAESEITDFVCAVIERIDEKREREEWLYSVGNW